MAKLATTLLGNTGLTVTRLSAGGHFTNGPSSHQDIPRRVRELHHLIDQGVRYFDVQWDPEELAMAEVIKTRRKEIAIAWPLHGVTQRGGDVTAQYVVDYCADHRKRFGIEHVDVLLWIALELNPQTQDKAVGEVRKGFEQLKAEGFCDFLGFSCHHSAAMALRAITSFDCFSVTMVPYSPLHPAAGRELLAAAKSRGVGTVGMKPFGGGGGLLNKVWAGELTDPAVAAWRGSGQPYQAALKWVLQEPNLDCTVPGMHSIQQIDELLAAGEAPLTADEHTLLETLRTFQRNGAIEVQLRGDWD